MASTLHRLFLLWIWIFSAPAWAGSPSFQAAPATTLPPPPELPEGWISVRGLQVTVHADPRDRATAQRLQQHADAESPRLADALGVPAGPRMVIVLSPDQEHFMELQPHAPPSWADGTAWPSTGHIYLRAPRSRRGDAAPLIQVLEHELVHIILGRAFAAGSTPEEPLRVPAWLQEGAAQVLAKEVGPEVTRRIASGSFGSGLLSLEELHRGFPDNAVRARLAYAQSADFVAWMRTEHGEEAFRAFVRASARGTPLGAALRGATGQSLDQLDRAWRARLAQSPLWFVPLVSDTMLFGFAGLMLIFGGRGVLRRRRERLAAMEVEEAARERLYAALQAQEDPPPDLTWPHPQSD